MNLVTSEKNNINRIGMTISYLLYDSCLKKKTKTTMELVTKRYYYLNKLKFFVVTC